ncbi:hypothetical protein [Alteriqipengyuania sp. 357]
MVLYILGVALFVAILAAGCAFAANVMFAGANIRKRAAISALVAGFLPAIPGIVALVAGMDGRSAGAMLVPIMALLVGGLVLTAIIGFPIAYLVARRRPDAISPQTFE